VSKTYEPTIEPLEDDLRELLRGAAAVPPAPVDARARVLAGVGSTVVVPALSASPTREAGSASAFVAHLGWVRRGLPWLFTFALGAGVGAFAARRVGAPPAPVAVTPMPTVTPMPAVTPMLISPAAAPGLGSANSVGSPRSDDGVPLTGPAPAPDRLAAESALLDRAQSALENARAAEALVLTRQHERAFAGGKLAQEREALAVRALVDLGRGAAARRRAARFHVLFPRSALWPTIEALLALPTNP